MKLGDLVKFSKDHISQPGLDYTDVWTGIIIESFVSTLSDDRVSIMWTIHGATHIMKYDEEWWSQLDYKPFEVISTIGRQHVLY